MNHERRLSTALWLVICSALISSARPAMACSVCYGDPNSPMTKGVEAGVLVLLAVVVTLLTLLGSLLLFWMRRAANLGDSAKLLEASVQPGIQGLADS